MYIDPMLLDDVKEPFESDQHIAELKIDGIRGVISKELRVRMYTRHNNEMTSRFDEVTAAVSSAIEQGTIIDGELVVCDVSTGKPNFAATLSRFQSTKQMKETPGLCFVAFDILAYRGKETIALPLMDRKALLEDAIQENKIVKRIRYIEHGFIPFFDLCREQELEGIVIKRRDSRYHVGKRPAGLWQRVVVFQREECVVTGFSKKSLAWSIGVKRGKEIISVGLLKHGLNGEMGKAVYPLLRKLIIKETKEFAFVEPLIHISVRFRHWTEAGKMRLPVLERVIILPIL